MSDETPEPSRCATTALLAAICSCPSCVFRRREEARRRDRAGLAHARAAVVAKVVEEATAKAEEADGEVAKPG